VFDLRSVFLVILWPLFEPRGRPWWPSRRATFPCSFATCLKVAGAVCRVWSGKEDKKQKYFLPLLPPLLLFCCYSYYYHHHHYSVTTISFITMICSFVSPQIHYFLFHFFHQPPSATHSSQICLFTARPLGTLYLILCPNHTSLW